MISITILPTSIANENGVPSSISLCYDEDNIITAIDIVTTSIEITINDLVAMYGERDVVTWAFSAEVRMAFWFEEGISASIRVDLSEQFSPYGAILSMTYFPYQAVEGFETR